jgi:hypothetical protein
VKALEIVRTVSLVFLVLIAAWVATHGLVIHHDGGIVVSCSMIAPCPGVP